MWLGSSVGRALQRYRKVVGSNPVSPSPKKERRDHRGFPKVVWGKNGRFFSGACVWDLYFRFLFQRSWKSSLQKRPFLIFFPLMKRTYRDKMLTNVSASKELPILIKSLSKVVQLTNLVPRTFSTFQIQNGRPSRHFEFKKRRRPW